MQGRYRVGASGTEWVARRLLARMHGYSKRSRRQSFEPVTAQDFMRFLLRWQHVAPNTQVSGEGGLVAVLEQLQGFEAGAAAWEPELFSRRLSHYEPGLARRAVPRRRGRLAAAHAPLVGRGRDALEVDADVGRVALGSALAAGRRPRRR